MEPLFYAILGALLSVVFEYVFDLRNEPMRRRLYGKWFVAGQLIYYGKSPEWNIQEVVISKSLRGLRITQANERDELQWKWDAKLNMNYFLTGPWKSTRESSKSHGFNALQLSANGKFLTGHSYGVMSDNSQSNFGTVLMARCKNDLKLAWQAYENEKRPHKELTT